MAASSVERVARLKLIERLLPPAHGARPVGIAIPDIMRKLEAEPGVSLPSRRTVERDLEELRRDGRVCTSDASAVPLRYLRVVDETAVDPAIWGLLREKLKGELGGVISTAQLASVLQRLQLDDEVALDPARLRILPDSLRLQPAPMKADVLGSILRALADSRALRVAYADRQGKRSDPVLHPLGLLMRGPRVYLYALKDEEVRERMYAVDRIIQADCLDQPARVLPGFDLDRCIASGRADFADGERIRFKAIVRGYVEQLVYDCPLADGQCLTPLPDPAAGSLLTVDMPGSGQLLRWILAGGGNITVLEPGSLRAVVGEQVAQMARHYAPAV